MPTLVIKSFPAELHSKLKQSALNNRRSVTQETIHLIEAALAPSTHAANVHVPSYWSNRKLIPQFKAALKRGAFTGGADSTQIISEERDVR